MKLKFSKPDRSTVIFVGALCVTSLALVLSVVAGLDRASGLFDKFLMAVFYGTFCMISHLILSLTKKKLSIALRCLVPILWFFSSIVTTSNHVSFLIKANRQAGEERAKLSIPMEFHNNEMKAVEVARSAISARKKSEIETDIAATLDQKKIRALDRELNEAKRRDVLDDRFLDLSHDWVGIQSTESVDPFFRKIAEITSINDITVSIIFDFCMSIFLEIAGVILWSGYSQCKNDDQEKSEKVQSSGDQIISTNKPSVNEIRAFLGCAQETAAQVHRTIGGQRRRTRKSKALPPNEIVVENHPMVAEKKRLNNRSTEEV
jgi:hypothetical protein